MNDIQKKLLEIAKEYINVCEELNLRYFLMFGSAIGALRHNGFIPWDDDIDFGMPRSDYELFLKEGQQYFPSNYFIQTHKSDKNYFSQYAKVRDNNTTAIEEADKNVVMNHGLWIDIFPLDGLPASLKKRKALDFLDFKILRRRYQDYKYKLPQLHIKFANFLVKIILPSKEYAYKKSIRLATKYNFDTSEYVFYMFSKRAKHNLKQEWFSDYKMHKFEDIDIRIPIECEKILEMLYGNWRELPPIEDRNGGHSIVIIDLKKSYKEYLKE